MAEPQARRPKPICPQAPRSRSWDTLGNPSMVGVGRDLCGSPSPTPCRSRVTQSRLHSTASRRVLNISREADSIASLGSLGQGSVTLRGKKFFPVFEGRGTGHQGSSWHQDVCIQARYFNVLTRTSCPLPHDFPTEALPHPPISLDCCMEKTWCRITPSTGVSGFWLCQYFQADSFTFCPSC